LQFRIDCQVNIIANNRLVNDPGYLAVKAVQAKSGFVEMLLNTGQADPQTGGVAQDGGHDHFEVASGAEACFVHDISRQYLSISVKYRASGNV
jgi:hypothetical protein